MTEATPTARTAVARWVAVALLVLLSLLAAPAQSARADGVVSGVTEDQTGAPAVVTALLYSVATDSYAGITTSDASTGAFSFASVPDGDYEVRISSSTGFVPIDVDVTVAGGNADVGTLSLYRFGTVTGTILNFSAVTDPMTIWVDHWTGSGWSTISGVTLVQPTGVDGYDYTVFNAIPGPGYYRVTFDPDGGSSFQRTYSGNHTGFPADDPTTTTVVGVFQATGYEQSFPGIDVTLGGVAPPSGGGSSSGGPSGGTSGSPGWTFVGSATPEPAATPDAEPTSEPTPTPEPLPTTQPSTPAPEPTSDAPAPDVEDATVSPWIFGGIAVLALLVVGLLAWLIFRRR